jgi:two-component sensor histidine kinase
MRLLYREDLGVVYSPSMALRRETDTKKRSFLPRALVSRGMKVTILVSFVVLLSGAFFVSWRINVTGTRALLLSGAEEIARSGLDAVSSELASFLSVHTALADSIADGISGRRDDDALPARFSRRMEAFPGVGILSVGFADGEYAEAQRLEDGSVRFGRAGASTGGDLVLYRPGPRGAFRTELRRSGYDPRTRPWYLKAADAPGIAWSDPYAYASNGAPAFAAAEAVRDRTGALVGVVSVTIGLDGLSGYLSSLRQIRGGGVAAVVDRASRVVAFASSVPGVPAPVGELLRPYAEFGEDAAALLSAALGGPPGALSLFSAGGERWRAINAEFSPGNLDWRVVMILPERRFLEPLAPIERRIALFYAVALIVVFAVAYLIANAISHPLRALSSAVSSFDLRAIDLGQPPEADPRIAALAVRRDEIGSLAQSFLSLGTRLDASFRSVHASLEEKNVLLKEVHHRVKNNLQVVSSLMSLRAGGSGDPEFAAAMQELQDRVVAMAAVHETLYSSGDLVSVPMDDYLGRVVDNLAAYRRGELDLTLTVFPGGVRLPIDQAIPCGLIAVELASNALKHAFPSRERGRVSLSLAPAGDSYLLTVADDGCGIPDGAFGGSGMGSVIVSALSSQLDGSFSVDTDSTGTRATVTFPRK